MERYQNIDMEDTQTWSNQAVFFTSIMEHVATSTCHNNWCV